MTSTEGPGPPDDGRSAKRKAGSPLEDANGRQQKRAASAPPPDASQLERLRQELAEVYSAYDVLYRAQQQRGEAEQQRGDGSSGAHLDSSFLRLVTAAQEGRCSGLLVVGRFWAPVSLAPRRSLYGELDTHFASC